MSGRRQLIKDFYDNEQRPMWQTDLAQQLLWTQLPEIDKNGAEFYEFGVPTDRHPLNPLHPEYSQREEFERAVNEAVMQMLDGEQPLPLSAHGRHSQRRAGFREELCLTMASWPRMKDEYYDKQTRYFVALAAYDATLLPDSNRLCSKTLARKTRTSGRFRRRPPPRNASGC